MRKVIIYLILIVSLVYIVNGFDNDATDPIGAWAMNETLADGDIFNSGTDSLNLSDVGGAVTRVDPSCKFISCYLSLEMGDYWRNETSYVTDHANMTLMLWVRPTKPESQWDYFAGDNDAFYYNFQTNNRFFVNVKDGDNDYHSVKIIDFWSYNMSPYLFWGWVNSTDGNYDVCGALNYSYNQACNKSDGDYADKGNFDVGSNAGSNQVEAYFEYVAFWNRTLNITERECVYNHLYDGNLSPGEWGCNNVAGATTTTTTTTSTTTTTTTGGGILGDELNWTYFPKNAFITPTSHLVSYKTNQTSNWTIEYGLTSSYGTAFSENPTSAHNDIEITGLSADTQYFYRVNASADNEIGQAEIISYESNFTTAPSTNRDFKFCQISDVHIGNGNWFGSDSEPNFRHALQVCKNESVDFVAFTGDTIEGLNYANYTENYYFLSLILKEELPFTPIYAIPGYGHDPANGVGGSLTAWQEFHTHPDNGNATSADGVTTQVGNETVWHFNYSYGCFVGISNVLNQSVNGRQFQFINESMRGCNRNDNWFIASFSHVPYNESPVLDTWYNYQAEYANLSALQFSGHFHSAGFNRSQNHYRISSIDTQWSAGDCGGFDFGEEYCNHSQMHFGIISVNSTTAQIDIWNKTTILNTSFWQNPNPPPPTTTTTTTTTTTAPTTTTTLAGDAKCQAGVDGYMSGFGGVGGQISLLFIGLIGFGLILFFQYREGKRLNIANIEYVAIATVGIFIVVVVIILSNMRGSC